jgi:hypothetical protein
MSAQPRIFTVDELDEFCLWWWGSDNDERTVTDVIESGSMTAFAEACIARWGTPANTTREQALKLLDKAEDPSWDINDFSIVRLALEQLDD